MTKLDRFQEKQWKAHKKLRKAAKRYIKTNLHCTTFAEFYALHTDIFIGNKRYLISIERVEKRGEGNDN